MFLEIDKQKNGKIPKANTLDKRNLSFVGIEIDKDYFDDSIKRFKNYKSQGLLF